MNLLLCAAVAVCVQAPVADQAALMKTFRDEFVAISPGQGSFPAELKIPADVGGEPRVLRPTSSFSIAKYEVPQNLYENVMGRNSSRWKGPRNSVEMISLAEAKTFCQKATELLRRDRLIGDDEVVRLPTELEWEYACRAATTTAYSFGDDAAQLDEYGWHNGNAAGNDPPVGAKKPNPWGLYDFHGYLAELCEPERDEKSADAAKTLVAARGGSWKEKAAECRSSSRKELS
ncbi:MAG TPA: formylglycine-generating enzyme family protein, partial [Pirellulales bacterium]